MLLRSSFLRRCLLQRAGREKGTLLGGRWAEGGGRRSSSSGRVFAALGAKKERSVYVCSNCGETYGQWAGLCRACKEYDTLKRLTVAPAADEAPKGGGGGAAAARAVTPRGRAASSSGADGRQGMNGTALAQSRGGWLTQQGTPQLQRLGDVQKGRTGKQWRVSLPGDFGAEVGRVVGGGVVPGSLILVGGEPGVGKSTLLLQLASLLSSCSAAAPDAAGKEADKLPVLYASAEESTEQVAGRAERLGLRSAGEVLLLSATNLADVLGAATSQRFAAVIVDSIQTVHLESVTGSAGSISQVRECAAALLHVAKALGLPVFLVGHVTKDDRLAGPRTLEHMVDCVLFMEGDRHQAFRLLRTTKNRYGATDEVGVFSMTEEGLVSVPNPSALFLAQRFEAPGVASCVTVTMEGTRPMLLEVQALATPTPEGQPSTQRANGLKDKDRLFLLIAVLAKHTRLPVRSHDIFTNVPGGLKLQEPASDLALVLAVASSVSDKPLRSQLAAVGEVGLGGELRAVTGVARRVAEAAKMGFTAVIVPTQQSEGLSVKGTTIVPCRTLTEALKAAGLQ